MRNKLTLALLSGGELADRVKKRHRLKKIFLDHFYDKKFHANKGLFISQCGLATLIILSTLLFLNVLTDDVVIAAIGATCFIVFAMPHKENSRARYILGSYLIGITVGGIFYFLNDVFIASEINHLHSYLPIVLGALAVGFTMFLMLITNLEHPPAAALALGLVVDEWSLRTVGVTLIALISLVIIRRSLKFLLIDLI